MNLKRNKSSGFTLMEIMISLFIVAILVAVTLPVLNKQLEKADEFSYYLAYKTVEKMAGQIAAIGDPTELVSSDNIIIADADDTKTISDIIAEKLSINKVKTTFISLSNKFAKSEEYIFKSFFPSSFADTVNMSTEIQAWDSDSFDYIWLAYKVCGGAQIPMKRETVTNADGTTSENVTYFAKKDFDNCDGYISGSNAGEILSNLMYPEDSPCKKAYLSSITNKINSSDSPDAKSICVSTFGPSCTGSDYDPDLETYVEYSVSYEADGEDVEDGTEEDNGDVPSDMSSYVETPISSPTGDCRVIKSYSMEMGQESSSVTPSARPEFSDADCAAEKGYYNMRNTSNKTISCECASGKVLSANYDNVCCTPCSGDGELPYAKGSYAPGALVTCKCCANDYNSMDNVCCPDNSVFVDGKGCECIEGYTMNNGVCVESECTSGSTMVDGVCVVNPPITKATRLCEQVKKYWNVLDDDTKYSCSGFTTSNGVSYNKAVYEAAKGSNGTLMSIKSKSGAFGLDADGNDKIKPNIIFANGLKMWILSDKQASIPGLSFTTENITPTRNVCKNLKKSTHISCYNEGGYFCKAEKNCFALDTESKAAMGDARNCCGSVDITDIAAAAQVTSDPDAYLKNTQAYAISGFTVFVDINGDKGSGTLWDDVYPFYIASNGIVYPAYPLDAPKGSTAVSDALYLGGNSSKQLSVDVYYYESTDESRQKKVAFPGVSFARGVCSARQISKYTPYCLNLGQKFYAKGLDNHVLPDNYLDYDDTEATGVNKSYNPCDKYKCFVSVRRKLRSF